MASGGPSREVRVTVLWWNSCEVYVCVCVCVELQDLQASTLGVVDSFRRTWDKAKYEKLAKDRSKKDGEGTS